MSEHIIKTIEQVREEIRKAEDSIRPKKILVNQLCELAGIEPVFTGIEDASSGAAQRTVIRRNAFFGKPLSTCIRDFLIMRASLPVREATLDEIFAALKEGGYDLKTSGEKEEDQKRGVAIAIGKNSQTFHRLPTGDYGLVAWYPNIKEKKSRADAAATATTAATTAATVESESAEAQAPEVQP